MANNLFVSYDLIDPGQNYAAIIAAIKKQGSWAKIQYSFFYLDTEKSAEQVAKAVRSVMDQNDSLIVIDATNNTAYWFNLSPEVSKLLRDRWNDRQFAA